ncbi:MAG: NmrA family NAD(P)-binding protein [Candidatus Acidiferrales bacterium]
MYVITGATGNTGRAVAEALLAKGEKVRVIGRKAEKLQSLVAKGAEAFAGDLGDATAMTRAFTGARAVYAMIPPDYASEDLLAYQARVADALGRALESAKVTHVVLLSSVGAQLATGTGPVSGLHHVEARIQAVPGLNVLALRPAYFFENFMAQAGVIRSFGMMAGALRADLRIPMIATRDIGARAAEELEALGFAGHQTRELLGERDLTHSEAAAIFGKAIGRASLNYMQVPNMMVEDSLQKFGFSKAMAKLMSEMNDALNAGRMAPLETRSAENTTPTKIETFAAEVFAPAFQGQAAGAH